MSQALYRKWRPQTWEAVIGQEHVIQTLRNALKAGRGAHAYLFAGPRGTGKTTTARLLAKAVNCLDGDPSRQPCGECEHCQAQTAGRFLDLIEIDAASNTSVEDVRSLRDKINFSPNQGRYKVYIIDEVHMLSTAAFNALLKTLEEPPPHAIFILATTEVHKIPATVLSRCQRHEFRRIPVNDIVRHLDELARSENIKVEKEALALIARQSTGAMRDAISLLDQLASGGNEITLANAQEVLGTAAGSSVLEVVQALLDSSTAQGLDTIHRTLDSGSDPRQYARQIVDYLRDLLLFKMGNPGQVDATAEMRAQMARHAQAFSLPELLRVIKAFNQAAADARLGWQPALPLEMAFVESMARGDEAPVGEAPRKTQPAAPRTSAPVEPAALGQPVVKEQPAASGQSAAKGQPATKDQPAAAEPTSAGQPDDENSGAGSEQDNSLSNRLAQNWPRILGMVRQEHPSIYGLLNSARSRSVRNGVLVLTFASDVLKFKMEKPDNLEVVQAVLAQALGEEVQVRCQTNAGKRSKLPSNVDSDGMVATALNDLGGEIVDVQ
jgi:DNA polymerase III subunit gamma/tau